MVATIPPSPLFLQEEELRRGVGLILAASQRLAASQVEALARHGLGPAQHRLLAYLGESPALHFSELAKRFQVSKQNLWRALRPLVERGLVVSVSDSEDRRRRVFSLTGEGRTLVREVSASSVRLLAAAYRENGPEAIEGFQRLLRSLAPEGWTVARTNMEAGS